MEEVKDNPIALRLPLDLKQWLVDLSKDERRSLNSQIVVLLEQSRRAIESSQTTKDGGRE